MMEPNEEKTIHETVLREACVAAFVENVQSLRAANQKGILVDCTLGGGGHLSSLIERYGDTLIYVAFDQDRTAIERAQKRFAQEIAAEKIFLVHDNFKNIAEGVRALKAKYSAIASLPTVGILADLGFSSDQLEDGDRGLSFRKSGPFDMRMDASGSASTAWDWVHERTEKELADLIFTYGEERLSRRIAFILKRAISQKSLVNDSAQIADLISRSVPPKYRYGRIHPATRTFQALRIAVNEELDVLQVLLKRSHALLTEGGRLAVISFHSLEDRMVKQTFNDRLLWHKETKKPIIANEDELHKNSRSRSAKLRIAQKKA